MVKNFKLFENSDWTDNYIILIPSGEVLYYNNINIEPLIKKNIIMSKVDNIYLGSDINSKTIKNFLENVSHGNSEKINVIRFLSECGLKTDQYEINSDLSVSAFAEVNMSFMNLRKIPVRFSKCTSNFICSHNELTTLENTPYTVHGVFNCSFNKLKNLKFGPKLVSKAYNCSNNELNSLEGSPLRVKVFNCSFNYLKDLHEAPVADILIKNDNLFQ